MSDDGWRLPLDDKESENSEDENEKKMNRSLNFSPGECKLLFECINKEKDIIFNKATNNEIVYMKNKAWDKVTEEFNNKSEVRRSLKVLKTKFNNMRTKARRGDLKVLGKYFQTLDGDGNLPVKKIKSEPTPTTESEQIDYFDDMESNEDCDVVREGRSAGGKRGGGSDPLASVLLGATPDEVDNSSVKMSDDGLRPPLDDRESENSEDENEKKMNRSLNFSPGENKLLFECINKEKDIIFNKATNNQIVYMKNKAWDKVTEEFNKKSDTRRSVKVLKTKFNNMRRKARRGDLKVLGKYFQTLDGDGNLPVRKIKSEPTPTTESEQIDYFDDMESNEDCDVVREGRSAGGKGGGGSDPLASVLLGATPESLMPWNQPECKVVVKLKMELLNYQIENAKLEKQRILQATELEAKNHEERAILNSLKLRAARLEATAAEMKFPPNHPSLIYTDTEQKAREYMLQ